MALQQCRELRFAELFCVQVHITPIDGDFVLQKAISSIDGNP